MLVRQPTVEDTVAILRGLKERYEVLGWQLAGEAWGIAAAGIGITPAVALVGASACAVAAPGGPQNRPRVTPWLGR